jgi:hypothetical protein
MQVIVYDLHFPFHDLRVKWFARCSPGADETGIVVDSFKAHRSYLVAMFCR